MPVCASKTADYLGTPGIDKIQAFDAVVFTGGGNDRIIGGSGATICAGEGDDTAALEFGPSRVFGGSGMTPFDSAREETTQAAAEATT